MMDDCPLWLTRIVDGAKLIDGGRRLAQDYGWEAEKFTADGLIQIGDAVPIDPCGRVRICDRSKEPFM
jgi:hypothetical protein